MNAIDLKQLIITANAPVNGTLNGTLNEKFGWVYLEYKENKKLQALIAEIGWVKNILINQTNFDIAKLKLVGIIKRIGSGRGSCYFFLQRGELICHYQ